MKKVALLILLIVMLIGAGIVSADPQNNPTAEIKAHITCDDGFDGDVLVPAFDSGPGGGPAGFFSGSDRTDLDGLGRPRELKITVFGDVVEYWSQPGNGYETTYCSFHEGPAFIELQIQRFHYTGD